MPCLEWARSLEIDATCDFCRPSAHWLEGLQCSPGLQLAAAAVAVEVAGTGPLDMLPCPENIHSDTLDAIEQFQAAG